MTTDVTNIQNSFMMIIRIAVRAPLMFIFSFAMCIYISPKLSATFLIAVVFLVIIIGTIMVVTLRIFDEVFHKYDELNASVQENVSAIRVVKAFVREKYENEKFSKASENIRKMFVKAEGLLAFNNPAMMTAVYFCIIMVSWLGAQFIVAGDLTTGDLTSLFSYIMSLLMSLMMLSMVVVMISISLASIHRVGEVLRETPDLAEPEQPVTEIADGSVDFDHVNFSYKHGSGKNALSGIDLHIRSGETIGVIGGTGCGKSSLVNLINAGASVAAATFPQTLVDDYIVPMIASGSTDFSGLAAQILRLAGIMALGVVAAFSYNRIMVSISQGTMCRLRNDLFRNMEALPIKYFDTHAHGDIMSVYTNDVDTLRQMLGQSTPQIINSSITMVATLVTMIVINPVLTVISILTAIVMLVVTKNFSRISGKYYIRQQRDLGVVDGFIEEMLDGQKVVKVFCHEEAAKADFAKVNESLRESADMANRYANLLMPINANIGWLSYALVAIVGAVLGINGLAGVTLGTVVTFVGLNKNFTQPITQVSQQVNFVVTAAAGAQRVFDLMDQKHETDEGYVELVNAKENADGQMEEVAERTNVWAWKHPITTAPPPTPSWKAVWCSRMWTSATTRTSWCSTT